MISYRNAVENTNSFWVSEIISLAAGKNIQKKGNYRKNRIKPEKPRKMCRYNVKNAQSSVKIYQNI